MQKIAELLPAEQASIYSSDPKIREEAQAAAEYPWEDLREGEDNEKYPAARNGIPLKGPRQKKQGLIRFAIYRIIELVQFSLQFVLILSPL